MGQYAAQLVGEAVSRSAAGLRSPFRIAEARVRADRFIFAGERVRFSARPAAGDGYPVLWNCEVASKEGVAVWFEMRLK
jgi:hypothetical protein